MLAAGALAQGPSTPPKFVDGDLATLSCKVRRHGKAEDTFVRLHVEVSNRGRHTAEPLSFELTPGGTVHRAPEPRLHRFGRGVPPSGKQTYILQFPMWKAPSRFKAKARVSHALFHDGPVLPEPKITVGRLQQDTYMMNGRSHPLTRCKVRNQSSDPVDLLFLATFTAPMDTQGLLHLHLAAGEEKEWTIRNLRTGLFEGGGIYDGARATKLRLVDWTTMVKGDPARAEETVAAFRRAHDRWIRWPDARVPLTGKFEWNEKGVDGRGKRDASGRGTFEIPSEGEPVVQFAGKVTDETRYQVARDLDRAFEDLRRPSLEKLLEHNKLVQVGPEWFEFTGRGLWLHQPVDGEPRTVRYRVEGDKITGFKQFASNPLVTWRLQEEPEGYLVSGREGLMSGSESERRTFQLLGDRFVPTSLAVDLMAKVAQWDYHRLLLLSDMRWQAGRAAAAADRKPPGGDAAAAVAALWERPYRYPRKKMTLSARFEFKNPGTGGEWAGYRKVTGRLKLLGFQGWRRSGSGYERAEIELDGTATPQQELALRSVLRGRLAMWASRDFAGRETFAEAFAGATITKDSATGDRFKVVGGKWTSLGANGDLIRWLEGAAGERRELRFQEIEGAWVPVQNKVGRGEIVVRWRRIADGWLLPVEITYKRVLGEEFGIESLKLSGVRLE